MIIRQNFITKYSGSTKRNLTIFTKNETNKKISIVKRNYPSDPKASTVILETKEASEVMKKLNWELKHMYGPILQPKTVTNQPILKRGVNYRTENLINDPTPIHEYDKPIISEISSFPLLNKTSNVGKSVFLNKANLLREDLLDRCALKPPSVSRILEKTMPEENALRLKLWKQKMIEELGEDGFKKYHEEILAKGSSLHASINSYLTSESEVSVQESNAGHWESLKAVFPQIKNIKLLEERVSHPFLCYQGIVDCFAEYRGRLVVVDWKTSKKSKSSLSSTFDNPLQIAAYVGALNFDSRLQYLVNNGLIVVAYESGSPASELFIDDEKMKRYWKEWLKRVKKYWEMVEAEQS
ncbi:hypothetical protein JTE90_026228 [Oedothorax gibbosus]|uniref:Mitochondrial genome maintenance exonuclease 1 n=1 Tax=Oedothorax gibbosus TaxID=931172 RepID=A0AAV6U9H3_9ARAC|nr:hypothetical protein JTE90_026228 [Oedothorax gibbosus]